MERCSGCGKERELFSFVEEVVLCDHCLGEMKTSIDSEIEVLESEKAPLVERLMANIEETLDELEDISSKVFYIFEDGDYDAESLKPILERVAALQRQFEVQCDVARAHYIEDIDLPKLESISTQFHAKLEEIQRFFEI